jgi:two-component system phosphate regulon response regulator PhoB
MKILLVDDEKDITEIVSEILIDKGHTVSTFDCPDKAIENLKDNQYDVIVSDYNFPIMRGDEFLTKLQAMSGVTLKRFLFLTGSTIDEVNFGNVKV